MLNWITRLWRRPEKPQEPPEEIHREKITYEAVGSSRRDHKVTYKKAIKRPEKCPECGCERLRKTERKGVPGIICLHCKNWDPLVQ